MLSGGEVLLSRRLQFDSPNLAREKTLSAIQIKWLRVMDWTKFLVNGENVRKCEILRGTKACSYRLLHNTADRPYCYKGTQGIHTSDTLELRNDPIHNFSEHLKEQYSFLFHKNTNKWNSMVCNLYVWNNSTETIFPKPTFDVVLQTCQSSNWVSIIKIRHPPNENGSPLKSQLFSKVRN